MTRILIVAAYLLKSLAGMCLLALVLGRLKGLRRRHPILQTAGGRPLWLVAVACLAWVLGSGAEAWKDHLDAEASLVLSQAPNGELVQRATPAALRGELTRAPSAPGSQASDGFDAGERDFAAMHYREAAWSYERSVRAGPTVAGYLNLGIALLILGEFQQAEDALRSGLERARRGAAERMEGAYLDALGWAHLGQGRLAAALASHRAALELHTRVGNPVGRATAHTNIGNVLFARGRLGEALLSYREAFRLYTRLENPMGRANALDHIGKVYVRLQDQDEALAALREALSLNRTIGNPLGQASDLAGISAAYLAQGKRREALEALRQSQALYRGTAMTGGSVPTKDGGIDQTKPAGSTTR
jgi:tetratricopeptide (TPR) repeat protein